MVEYVLSTGEAGGHRGSLNPTSSQCVTSVSTSYKRAFNSTVAGSHNAGSGKVGQTQYFIMFCHKICLLVICNRRLKECLKQINIQTEYSLHLKT